MMLVHQWIEYYEKGRPNTAAFLQRMAMGCVQFNCGPINDIPVDKSEELFVARAPFQKTILQFETPEDSNASHLMLLWEELPDESVMLILGQRRRDKTWGTLSPTIIKRMGQEFEINLIGNNKENMETIRDIHAHALNFFYVLGCSNVELIDHPAPKALNKKRERSGKMPILEFKTLTLKLDGKRGVGPRGTGTHASPRVHLRRGHVRQLQSGKRVWVQPCVVGSNHGMVLKDYRVVRELEATK